MKPLEKAGSTSQDFILKEHVESTRSASDRVRYITFTILVVCVLAIGGYRNSAPDSWTNLRVKLLRTALNHELYDKEKAARAQIDCWERDRAEQENEEARHAESEDAAEFNFLNALQRSHPSRCRDIQGALKLLDYRAITEREQLERRLALVEEVQIRQAFNVQVPFFGVGFDVNDLGLLTGITLVLLTMTHLLSFSRERENLHLCLWQVNELFCDEDRREDPRNEANLLYHSLAMAQLFSKPPSLAHWKPRASRWTLRLLITVPPLVQGLLFVHDLQTVEFGLVFKPFGTRGILLIEFASLLLITYFSTRSFICTLAIDKLWDWAFNTINPEWAKRDQPVWLKLIFKNPKPSFRAAPPGGRRSSGRARGSSR